MIPVDGLSMTALMTRLLKYLEINSLTSSSLNPSICSRVSQCTCIRTLISALYRAVATRDTLEAICSSGPGCSNLPLALLNYFTED